MTALALRPASLAALASARGLSETLADVQSVRLVSPEAETKASGLLRLIETASRDLERERKAEKEPHLRAGQDVDAAFRAVSGPLERVAASLRAELARCERARDDARRKALAEASAAARAGDAEKANEAILLANDPVFQPVALEGVAASYSWEIESIDPEKLSREFLMPDVKAIEAYAKAAAARGSDPVLEGVTFTRKVSHVVRRLP